MINKKKKDVLYFLSLCTDGEKIFDYKLNKSHKLKSISFSHYMTTVFPKVCWQLSYNYWIKAHFTGPKFIRQIKTYSWLKILFTTQFKYPRPTVYFI